MSLKAPSFLLARPTCHGVLPTINDRGQILRVQGYCNVDYKSCEHGNQPAGSIKCKKFLNQLGNCFFLSTWTLLPLVCSLFNIFYKFPHSLKYFRKAWHLTSTFVARTKFSVTVWARLWTTVSGKNCNMSVTHLFSLSFSISFYHNHQMKIYNTWTLSQPPHTTTSSTDHVV